MMEKKCGAIWTDLIETTVCRYPSKSRKDPKTPQCDWTAPLSNSLCGQFSFECFITVPDGPQCTLGLSL